MSWEGTGAKAVVPSLKVSEENVGVEDQIEWGLVSTLKWKSLGMHWIVI